MLSEMKQKVDQATLSSLTQRIVNTTICRDVFPGKQK